MAQDCLPKSRLAVMHLMFTAIFALFVPFVALGQPAIPMQVTSVVSGGYWQRGSESGTYRAVIVQEGWEHLSSRLYIEWISEPKSRNDEQKVVAQIEPALPFGQGNYVLRVDALRGDSSRAVLSVSAWSNMRANAKPVQVRFQLGGPGDVKTLPPKGNK